MNLPKLTAYRWVCLFTFVCLCAFSWGGCGKSTGSKGPAKPADAKQVRLAWNLETTVEAYDKVGVVNSAWDANAHAALKEFCRYRCRLIEADEPAELIIATNCDAAVAAGCTDPMMEYLYARYSAANRMTKQELADEYVKAALDIKDSPYPPIRKFYANMRAFLQLFSAYGTKVDQSTVGEVGTEMSQRLLDSLDDKSMPAIEAYEAGSEGLAALAGNNDFYEKLYGDLEKKMFTNWPETYTTWLWKGEAYIEMAWQSRGHGYADSVTKEGWQKFGERLATAEGALDHAWALNTNDVRIPLAYMRLEVGLGRGVDRMEMWFQRAMAIDPYSYDACRKKLNCLEPKWYGSAEAMLEFGRECVNSTEWKGRVPLILVDAHVELANYVDEDERDGYWKRPEVWPDIKAAYDKFFELNPDAVGYYHNYVWYAYHCEQWDALNALLPKLGTINYDFFGGADEFEKMVNLAKEHAKK